MYNIAWQSMLIEALVFVVLGIAAVLLLRFYSRKHALRQVDDELSKSLDSQKLDSHTQDVCVQDFYAQDSHTKNCMQDSKTPDLCAKNCAQDSHKQEKRE